MPNQQSYTTYLVCIPVEAAQLPVTGNCFDFWDRPSLGKLPSHITLIAPFRSLQDQENIRLRIRAVIDKYEGVSAKAAGVSIVDTTRKDNFLVAVTYRGNDIFGLQKSLAKEFRRKVGHHSIHLKVGDGFTPKSAHDCYMAVRQRLIRRSTTFKKVCLYKLVPNAERYPGISKWALCSDNIMGYHASD